MKILHIISDEKFVKFCEDTFDIEFVNNFYLRSGQITFDYLKSNNISLIIIHYLHEFEVNFFYYNKVSVPKIWMFWGADGFSLPLFYNKFLDSESKMAVNRMKFENSIISGFKHLVKNYFNTIWNKSFSVKKKLNVMNQMDYIVPIVPGDYDILKESYNITAPIYHFNYVVELTGGVNDSHSGNIILGNSSSITNNHISILRSLNTAELGASKVFIPLSYGDSIYRRYILDFIKSLNNSNLKPLTEFLNYSSYSEIIQSCDIMIMNHERQQALGNIVLGLLNGCTIYMNDRSPLYRFLIDKKFIIKNVNTVRDLERITPEEKRYNSSLTREVFSKQRQHQLVRALLTKF